MTETEKALCMLNDRAIGMIVFHVKFGRGKVVYTGDCYWEIEFENFENTGLRGKMLDAYWCFEQGLLTSAVAAFDNALKDILRDLRAETDN